jgi:hypothetical protein
MHFQSCFGRLITPNYFSDGNTSKMVGDGGIEVHSIPDPKLHQYELEGISYELDDNRPAVLWFEYRFRPRNNNTVKACDSGWTNGPYPMCYKVFFLILKFKNLKKKN